MKRLVISILVLPIAFSGITRAADEPNQVPLDRFEKVANGIVKAYNKADYAGIQKDFSGLMLKNFPLEKSEPFFKNMKAQYGKFKNLGIGQFVPPNQAIFPAQLKRGALNIKVVLDDNDKIIGLWFLPPALGPGVATEVADANSASEDPNAVEEDEELVELKDAIEALDQDAEPIARELTRRTISDRTRLANAIQEVVSAEIAFLREVAVSENAEKTVRAIDLLIKKRNERHEELKERLIAIERREAAREERERTRRSSRTRRSRSSRRDQEDE